MKLTKTLHVSTRKAWRAWLAKHHATEPDIWLIYYRKETSKERVSYNDAVEEALCYGWIDSTVKSLDAARFAQRFSPRRKTSVLSQANRERIRRLIAEKKMTKAGLAALAHVFDPAENAAPLVVPPYIQRALKGSPGAWEHFQRFPERYRRIRVAYIESQKRHGKQQHQRALRHFVNMTAKNKRFGFIKK